MKLKKPSDDELVSGAQRAAYRALIREMRCQFPPLEKFSMPAQRRDDFLYAAFQVCHLWLHAARAAGVLTEGSWSRRSRAAVKEAQIEGGGPLPATALL